MDEYTVSIISRAEKEFLKLPEVIRNKIREKILLLEDNPRPFWI
jgi:mRNA-degrading endonuclease RelE of RelBE toxin-antitoxin system